MIDSTVAGNSAWNNGGGLLDGTVTITNSTFSGNTGVMAGGVMVRENLVSDVTLTNVTITDNTPNGVCSWTELGAPYVENSIIAGNNGSNCGFPVAGRISLGFNLSDDASCPFAEAGDLLNLPALLGVLTDNGGPTQTHALQFGSPALDAADDSICPKVDQRGVSRPTDGDGDGFAQCDMGALEVVPEPAGALPLVLGACVLSGLGRRRRSVLS